ncbi:unnamed protein product [Amoebophrya sp. A120]|nr:unnamed protein product [Amoebophrya sp. A120]|eukprot:GSA120T00000256001.1
MSEPIPIHEDRDSGHRQSGGVPGGRVKFYFNITLQVKSH